MSIENQFGWVGHCLDLKENHDKVWGYFYRPTPTRSDNWWDKPTIDRGMNCCVFWARRGKSMQFKSDVTGYELQKLVNSKIKKGYVKISQPKLFEIWSTFIEEAEGKLMWDVLAGKIK